MADTRYEAIDSFYSPESQRMLAGTPYLLFMASKCVVFAGKGMHYLVCRRDGTWEPIDGHLKVCQVLADQWSVIPINLPNYPAFVITIKQIKEFVFGPQDGEGLPFVPVVDGKMMVPNTAALGVRYRGHLFVNTYRDTMMTGDAEAVNDPAVRPWLTKMLRMLREGICGMPEALDLDTMLTRLAQRHADDLAFRFTMSWWAATLQCPGINLQTNLCHLGTNQGVGKGTWQEIMRRVMGGDKVLTANASEFQRGWTDQMQNRLVICINEITGDGVANRQRIDWNQFIKTYCNEAEITVATRFMGIGTGPLPNFTNWVFTDNSETPFRIDEDDRRNALFPTNNDRDKNILAEQVSHDFLLHGDIALVERTLQALTYLLRTLQVEYRLIAKPVENDLRDENKAANADDNIYWLAEDQTYERDVAHKPGYWADSFNRFTKAAPDNQMSAKRMSAILQSLARKGYILGRSECLGKAVLGKKRKKWLFTVPSNIFPKDPTEQQRSRNPKQRMAELRGLPAPVEETRH